MPIESLFGDDEVDTALLKAMAEQARAYLGAQSWVRSTHEGYFAAGFGGIFAIFLFRIEPTRPGIDNWMWIVTGDIPSIYLPLQDAANPKEVFYAYVQGMCRWISMVREKRVDGPDIPPMTVPVTAENADDLERRIAALMEMLPPALEPTVQ